MPRELLRAEGICKAFGGESVLRDVNLVAYRGGVHAVFGKNGAGKTVLMNILSGELRPDAGTVLLDGEPRRMGQRDGAIRVVRQGINLVPNMSVLDNLFLGEWMMGPGRVLIDRRGQRRRGEEILAGLGAALDLDTKVSRLDLNLCKLVEVARALLRECRVLILDEATAYLGEREKKYLYDVMRGAAGRGTGVLFITHDISEIHRVADTVTFLQDGRVKATVPRREFSQHQLMAGMRSDGFVNRYPRLQRQRGDKLLEAVDLSVDKRLHNVSFSLNGGEILGVTGLAASGRNALAQVVSGQVAPDSGRMFLMGDLHRPWRRQRSPVAYMPGIVEDGLVASMGVSRNVTLSHLDGIRRGRVLLDTGLEERIAQDYARRLGFDGIPLRRRAGELSGGTAQKVLMSKGLYSNARLYVFHEPTASLDAASKVEAYNLMNELILQRYGVMIVSSNIEEIVGMCHRVLVLYRGRLAKVLSGADISEEAILYHASGLE